MPTTKPTDKFFRQETTVLARQLLGMELVTVHNGYKTSGIIVETEAYLAEDDPACHANSGRTKRNEVMFWDGGFCYVYLIYGIHHCVNVVSEHAGRGCAVLIRALQPLTGIKKMKQRRKLTNVELLTSGPGKICQALQIDTKLSGENLRNSEVVYLSYFQKIPTSEVGCSTRIGITKGAALDLRFFVKGNNYVSKLLRSHK